VELLQVNPAIFLSNHEQNFSPVVQGQQVVGKRALIYRLVLSQPESKQAEQPKLAGAEAPQQAPHKPKVDLL
jgi:hypothetical protein